MIVEGGNIDDEFQIKIIDLTGIKLTTGSFREEFIIYRTDFQQGAYIYKTYDKSGNSYMGKFIVI